MTGRAESYFQPALQCLCILNMPEPFTAFATVAGVAALVLQALKALSDDVQSIQGAPAVVKTLTEDLDALATILQTIPCNTEGSLDHLSVDANAALIKALENCNSACDHFQAKLKKWTKHSSDQYLQWWDRVRVGIFAEKNAESLSKQLIQSKVTLSIAIGIVTL
jgi:hypothetical protein